MEISNGTLTAAINPLGAELTSLRDSDREYIWEGDPKFWPKHSPVLFPIVGCLKNNTYRYEGRMYAMTRHGFARDNIFSIAAQSENSATFVLTANNDTTVMYPFDFKLELRYTLKGSTLFINYAVSNESNKKMPFALGAHPAFALPKDFTSYSLIFEQKEKMVSRRLDEGLITDDTIDHGSGNEVLPLTYDLFKNDALVFTNLKSRQVELLEGENALLKVRYEKFPHLGIWTKDKAPFICIEPWQGYADKIDTTGNIIEKEGSLTLQPGEKYTAEIEIQILS